MVEVEPSHPPPTTTATATTPRTAAAAAAGGVVTGVASRPSPPLSNEAQGEAALATVEVALNNLAISVSSSSSSSGGGGAAAAGTTSPGGLGESAVFVTHEELNELQFRCESPYAPARIARCMETEFLDFDVLYGVCDRTHTKTAIR